MVCLTTVLAFVFFYGPFSKENCYVVASIYLLHLWCCSHIYIFTQKCQGLVHGRPGQCVEFNQIFAYTTFCTFHDAVQTWNRKPHIHSQRQRAIMKERCVALDKSIKNGFSMSTVSRGQTGRWESLACLWAWQQAETAGPAREVKAEHDSGTEESIFNQPHAAAAFEYLMALFFDDYLPITVSCHQLKGEVWAPIVWAQRRSGVLQGWMLLSSCQLAAFLLVHYILCFTCPWYADLSHLPVTLHRSPWAIKRKL